MRQRPTNKMPKRQTGNKHTERSGSERGFDQAFSRLTPPGCAQAQQEISPGALFQA